MARRKKGNPVHGWVVLDKHAGLTSTQAVAAVRRLFDAQKAGHAGTLDPLASGVLPIALGEATKTVSFTVDGAKAYQFTIQWGIETDTDDAEGKLVRESSIRPDAAQIARVLPDFIGEIAQVPPSFSAIKLAGERAYDLAREGEAVSLEPRMVTISRFELVDSSSTNRAMFEAECGKGTYVRALARDVGRALGCYGHVVELRRTRVGLFSAAQALTLDRLQKLAGESALGQVLLPVAAALGGVPALSLSTSDATRLRHGRAVLLRGRDAPILSGSAYATCRGELVAIGEIDKGELRPTRVFNWS